MKIAAKALVRVNASPKINIPTKNAPIAPIPVQTA